MHLYKLIRKMADNLKKQVASYVPGIRPGEQTKNILLKFLYRLTFCRFYLLSRYFNSTDISNLVYGITTINSIGWVQVYLSLLV